MNGQSKLPPGTSIDKKLRIRKALQEITNSIHAAQFRRCFFGDIGSTACAYSLQKV
jgi:hypothetical protein